MRPRMAADSAGRGGSLELTMRVDAGLGRGSSFAKTVTLPEAWFGQAHPEQGVQNIVVFWISKVLVLNLNMNGTRTWDGARGR